MFVLFCSEEHISHIISVNKIRKFGGGQSQDFSFVKLIADRIFKVATKQ